MATLSIVLAFLAGLLSFLSPCVLPLLPGYLGFLSGMSGPKEKGANLDRLRLFANAVFFVLGFTLAFALIGLLLSGILSYASFDIRLWLSRIGGLAIIAFGLFVLGVLKVPALEQEYKLPALKTRYQYLTSALFGISFAVGWSPCVGAVLGSILSLSVSDIGGALAPMLAYSAGLAVPFLLIGLFGTQAIALMRRMRFIAPYFSLVAGALLVAIGMLVFSQQLNVIANLVLPQSLLPYFSAGGP